MHFKIFLSVNLSILLLTGCSHAVFSIASDIIPQKIFISPVKGPVLEHNPNVTITGLLNNIGSISIKFPNEEPYKGTWTRIPQAQPENDMSSHWDLIYGQGYFTKNILGEKWRLKAKLTNTTNNIIYIELHNHHEQTSSLRGVAVDLNGNIYKITN